MVSLTLILTCPPYSSCAAKEHLDMALAAGNFDTDVTLIFTGDGVFNVVDNQQPEKTLQQKPLAKTYGALPFYDVENVFVCADSLKQRNIDATQLIDVCTVKSASNIKQLIGDAQHVVVF